MWFKLCTESSECSSASLLVLFLLLCMLRRGLPAASSLFKFKLTHRPRRGLTLHISSPCVCVCMRLRHKWAFAYLPYCVSLHMRNVCVCFSELICVCVWHPHVAVVINGGVDCVAGGSGASEKTASLCLPLCLTHADRLLVAQMDDFWSPTLTLFRGQRSLQPCKLIVTCFIPSCHGQEICYPKIMLVFRLSSDLVE